MSQARAKPRDNLTTLEMWDEWVRMCQVARCQEATRVGLGRFIAYRLERYVGKAPGKPEFRPDPSLAEDFRVDPKKEAPGLTWQRAAGVFDAYIHFRNTVIAPRKSKTPVLKLWFKEQTDLGLGHFEGSASNLAQMCARRYLRELQGGKKSIFAAESIDRLGEKTPDKPAVEVALTGATRMTPAALERLGRSVARQFFESLNHVERVGAWAQVTGVPLSHPESIHLAGLKTSRFAELVKRNLPEKMARLDLAESDQADWTEGFVDELRRIVAAWRLEIKGPPASEGTKT